MEEPSTVPQNLEPILWKLQNTVIEAEHFVQQNKSMDVLDNDTLKPI